MLVAGGVLVCWWLTCDFGCGALLQCIHLDWPPL